MDRNGKQTKMLHEQREKETRADAPVIRRIWGKEIGNGGVSRNTQQQKSFA